MSDHDQLTVDSARGCDEELFTAPSTDHTPDRHPSILRPGGHSSPLKHPAALRPGAVRHSRTPSPSNGGPTPPPARPPRASPSPVAYKAYSPAPAQSLSDELSAQIEGYFTALEVPPLHIARTHELPAVAPPPLPPKQQQESLPSPMQGCASPPVPPKEKLVSVEEQQRTEVVRPLELEAPPPKPEHPSEKVTAHVDVDEAEPPPPYEASESVMAPPEKAPLPSQPSKGTTAGGASAAHIGDTPAGNMPVTEATASPSAASAAVALAETQPAKQAQAKVDDDEDDIYSDAPPPLPPRPEPSSASSASAGKGKEPAAPPEAGPSPSRPAPAHKASGAAATSAAGVGGSIAGVGQSASLKQARKALEKGLGHLIGKAKEVHHAREQQAHERKTSKAAGKKGQSPERGGKKADSAGSVAQVRMMKP